MQALSLAHPVVPESLYVHCPCFTLQGAVKPSHGVSRHMLCESCSGFFNETDKLFAEVKRTHALP